VETQELTEVAQAVTDETPETETGQDAETVTMQPEAQSVGDLPEWAQKLITETRGEAAKYRKERAQAKKEADAAARKQAEEQGEFKRLYEEANAKLAEAEQRAQAAELARLKADIGTRLQLPAALIDRLRGETAEELEADAKALLDALPKVQTVTSDRRGGRGEWQDANAQNDDP